MVLIFFPKSVGGQRVKIYASFHFQVRPLPFAGMTEKESKKDFFLYFNLDKKNNDDGG